MTIPTSQRFWQKLQSQKIKDWGRPQYAVIALSLIILATTWSVTWHWLGKEQELMLKNSQARQESLAIIISENFNRAMD